jgi:putative transposase
MPDPHRKRLQHINEAGHLHFPTFSCYERRPLLTNHLFRGWLAESLNKALITHRVQLCVFVFMPEHAHLLLWPQDALYSIADFCHSFKRPFSLRVKNHLVKLDSPLLRRLTIRERPGRMTFRFWQEGGGHDLNVWSEKYIWTKLDYMHNNPVQRGLVRSPDLWKWSSWKAWHQPEEPCDGELPAVTVLKF